MEFLTNYIEKNPSGNISSIIVVLTTLLLIFVVLAFLNDYKYTLEKLDLEISRLADSNKGDSNITTAIQMANQGRSLEEISSATGLSKEEIEPILKYHGK